jgi:diketogulonate reductase-like aldo/keto reductase
LFDLRNQNQKPWIAPIPGTTKQAHLMENLAIAARQFSTAKIGMLDKAISQLKIFGDRYTEVGQKRVKGASSPRSIKMRKTPVIFN